MIKTFDNDDINNNRDYDCQRRWKLRNSWEKRKYCKHYIVRMGYNKDDSDSSNNNNNNNSNSNNQQASSVG